MATRVEAVAVPMAEAVSMVVGTGRLHHQLELSRPTAFAVGRLEFLPFRFTTTPAPTAPPLLI